jgi:S1-C subfamily serine protease
MNAALLLALLLSVTGLRAQDPSPAELPVERWMDSVVVLITGSAWCSAVVVDDQGTVATAYHCVASGRRPHLVTRDGERVTGRVVATAPKEDLALLEAPALAGGPGLPLRERPAVLGESVWALGHPFAPQADASPLLAGTLQWSAGRGVVSAVGQRLVQVDVALNPGNSGGPIVDEEGAIVGIASRRLSGDNIAFISPVGGLHALIDAPDKALLGGTWGASISALQGLGIHDAPSLGAAAELGLRDRILLRGALLFPLGQRWTALSLGRARWIAGELSAVARLRVGHGRWSTTLDLGGAGLLIEGVEASFEDDGVDLWATPSVLAPGGVVSLGMGGSSFRLLLVHEPSGWSAMVGVDLGFPGVMGVF